VGPAGKVLDDALERAGIGRDRGTPQESELAELVTLTAHPSSILRAHEAARAQAMDELVADLSEVGRWIAAHRDPS
jgi:hypothetical protein